MAAVPRRFPGTDFPADLDYGGLSLSRGIEGLLRRSVKVPDAVEGWSIGWALVNSTYAGRPSEVWDDFDQLIECVGGWGANAVDLIWNAVQVVCTAARLTQSTADLKPEDPDSFADVFTSSGSRPIAPDPWDSFPYGGAAVVGTGDWQEIVGVSTGSPVQDKVTARRVADYLRAEKAKIGRR